MKFTLLFKVEPAGRFGLPQEGVVVLPGDKQQNFVGPTLDSRSGQLVGHGKLSEYRSDNAAIQFSGQLGGQSLSVRDNFFSLEHRVSRWPLTSRPLVDSL